MLTLADIGEGCFSTLVDVWRGRAIAAVCDIELPTMPTLPTGFRFAERIHAERFANEKLVGNVGIVGKSMFFPCAMRFLAARELPTLPTTFDA